MNKNAKIILGICGGVAVIAVIVVVAIVLAGGGGGMLDSAANEATLVERPSEEESVNTDTTEPSTNDETSGSSLVGEWKYYDPAYSGSEIEFIYTFNADGTGNYYAAGTDMPFTYTTDGTTITINYDSGPFETEYEINGDILNVKDSGGSDTLYKKM